MLISSLKLGLVIWLLPIISASCRSTPGGCDGERRNRCSIRLNPGGCNVANEWYTNGSHSYTNCSGFICSENGGIEPWSDCPPDTPEISLPPVTGCYVNGKVYAPGEYKFGQDGDYCYGILCHPEGFFTDWNDWLCQNFSVQSISINSSPPPDATQTGCNYNGRWYSPGSYKHGHRYDRCDGFICNDDGTIADCVDEICVAYDIELESTVSSTRWLIETETETMLERVSSFSPFVEGDEELDQYLLTSTYPTEPLVWE